MLNFFVPFQTRLHFADTNAMDLYVGGNSVFELLVVADWWPEREFAIGKNDAVNEECIRRCACHGEKV